MPRENGRNLLDPIPLSWSGTADDLAKEVERVVRQLGLPVRPPSVRTIRLWRTKRLLGREEGRRFERQQILQALATAILLARGWSAKAIADSFVKLADSELERIIRESREDVHVQPPSAIRESKRHEAAEDAVILLAQGILLQYRGGFKPGREIVRQGEGVPPELQSAMCRIGRLYIEEGKEDRAACVHDVLARARYPLASSQWDLAAFRNQAFRFANVVLVESELRVPTPDCASIAAIAGSFGEDNVVEHRLHARLRDTADRFGARRHEAYSGIRELTVRHSLIDEGALIRFLDERNLRPALQSVVDDFYDPVPEAWLNRGKATRCAHCRSLMRPHADRHRYADGVCPIRQCAGRRVPEALERLDLSGLLVAKPQILTYWTGPGIDELAIYDAASSLGLDAELYPETDACDVSIGGRMLGIDAKSYSSAVSLGLRLNRGIGGLINYRRRIVAISDGLLATDPHYLYTLRSTLDPKGDQRTLELMTVSAVIEMLKEVRRATEA